MALLSWFCEYGLLINSSEKSKKKLDVFKKCAKRNYRDMQTDELIKFLKSTSGIKSKLNRVNGESSPKFVHFIVIYMRLLFFISGQ